MNKTKFLTKKFFVAICCAMLLFVGVMVFNTQKTENAYADTDNYLTFTAVGGSVNITFDCLSGTDVAYKKSTDQSWTSIGTITTTDSDTIHKCNNVDYTGTVIALESGQSVKFRGTRVITSFNSSNDFHFAMSATTVGATVQASGDVTSLTNGNTASPGGDVNLDSAYIDYSGGCYNYMFMYCRILTTPPNLPSTTLVDSCYFGMFMYCSGLTTVPELPATTLENNCYNTMFKKCTNLTAVPALPATSIPYTSYTYMFSGCTKITSPADLSHVTDIRKFCCSYMYESTGIKIFSDTTDTNYTYKTWKATSAEETSASENWNKNMFKNCEGDVEAPTCGQTYYIGTEKPVATGMYFDNTVLIISGGVALVAGVVVVVMISRRNKTF